MKSPVCYAVILAGGRGRRAGQAKQFCKVGRHDLLYHACLPFLKCREVDALVVVVPARKLRAVKAELEESGLSRLAAVVAGGSTRNASSRAGLAAVPGGCEMVLIHDAARPLASPALIRRVLKAARSEGAAVPACPVHDSMVELDAGGHLAGYLSRQHLRAVQTPQAFRREILQKAFDRVKELDYTDDASVVRAAGMTVAVVEGDEENRKITTPAELQEALAKLGGGR